MSINEQILQYQKKHDPEKKEEILGFYLPLAKQVVKRFLYWGEPADDLLQIACIGLLKAIDRFDVGKGKSFEAFAVPTMIGEIRHYFRDHRQLLKIPRRIESLIRRIKLLSNDYLQRTGRSPSVAELALRLECPEEEITGAMEAGQNFSLLSLDYAHESQMQNEFLSLHETVMRADHLVEEIHEYTDLKQAISILPPREKRILHMRFFQNLQQEEIARQLQISQVHVSRLLTKMIKSLRQNLDPVKLAVSESKRDRQTVVY